jgi:hypothetical protein
VLSTLRSRQQFLGIYKFFSWRSLL